MTTRYPFEYQNDNYPIDHLSKLFTNYTNGKLPFKKGSKNIPKSLHCKKNNSVHRFFFLNNSVHRFFILIFKISQQIFAY